VLNTPSAPVLIGRESQLSALREFVERLHRGRAGTILVRGDAGAGKTRLVNELAAEARVHGATVLQGGCVAIGDQPLRHAAFIELLRGAPRRAGTATADQGIAGLSTERMLEHLLALVDGVTAPDAYVLIVEDVHWADRGTCEILTVLARHVAGCPVGVVMTCREELPRDHHVRQFFSELVRAELVHPLAVPALTAAEVAGMVEALVGDVDAVTVARVFERSAGNPLIVEELCAQADPGSTQAIEGPLRDILLGRFLQLSEPAREIVRAVAVAGSSVDQLQLASVVGVDDKAFAVALREALDLRVLVRNDESVGLRHVLMAEAVYDDLLAVERVRIHARWAEALRGGAAPLVAHHWYEAGAHEPAFDANLAAAREATAAMAFETAHRYYRQTLSLWDRVPHPAARAGTSRGDLVLQTAETANWSGNPAAGIAIIDAALGTHEIADDPATTSVLLERRAWYLLRQGANEAARRAYDAALATLPEDADPATRVRVLAGSVRAWERASDFDRALALAREAVNVAVSGHVEAEIGPAHYMLGRILLSVGATNDAIDELTRAADAAETALNPVLLAISLLERADALARHGQLAEAIPAALAASDRLRARGQHDPHALLAAAAAGALQYRLGRPTEGRAIADAILAEGRNPVTLALGHLLAGSIDVERMELTSAREHLETARILAAPLLDGRVGAALSASRAELALAEGNVDNAVSAVEEGIGKVAHSGDDEALAHLCLFGLRLEGERAARAVGRDSERSRRRRDATIDGYERRLRHVLDAAPDAPHDSSERPDLAAIRAAWRAERQRLDGRDDPEAWAAAMRAWARAQWPRLAAYASLRQAEAIARDGASTELVTQAIDDSAGCARAIESALLLAAVAELVHRTGVDVATRANGSAPPPSEPTAAGLADLTKREREVLDLVAAGATNRQIASRLFISDKTASVHVSRILTKLGAASRQEASAIARRASRSRRP
jgi:DNA-binding NarL/FixJ family response regulator